jgi:hypothetical protein
MSVRVVRGLVSGRESAPFPSAEDVVEIPLLLPGWQAETLEALAHVRGLTVAELVRRLLTDFIACARAS